MHNVARRLLFFTGLMVAFQTRIRAADATNSDRIVVMISIDGLAAYYLDDPKADMPMMRKLAAEGARDEYARFDAHGDVAQPHHPGHRR